MKPMKRYIALILALCLCGALFGCSRREEGESYTFRAAISGVPATLDPAMVTSAAEKTAVAHLFENLMKLSGDSAVSGVARSYTCTDNEDGTQTYVFTLRDDVRWSDGAAVKAEDFVFAWQRLLDPELGSPNASILNTVKGYAETLAGDPEALQVWADEDGKLVVVLSEPDPYFLNAVCDCMAEISMRRLTQYEGNYDRFAVQRQANLERQLKEYKMQQAEIARQEAIIARYRMYNREKSIRAAESREKRLERMEKLEKPVSEQKVRFSFEARRRSGDDVLIAKELSKGFDGRTLFEHFNLHLRAGDRVAVIGANGVGKTTLLKLITGQLPPDSGTVVYGSNVDVGYYDQQQSGLHPEKDVLNELWDDFPRLEIDRVRGVLALFLLTGDDVFQPISTLSGGEKGRVALAKLMLRKDNLLLLDEPTNHLDMDSREVLEDALDDFDGTLLTVSHDRYFINRVANRVVEMRPDGVTEYLGNYDDYVEKKRLEADGALAEAEGGKTRTQLDKEKRRERLKQESAKTLKLKLKQAEQAIADTEERIAQLEARMADPETYKSPDAAQKLAQEHRDAQ